MYNIEDWAIHVDDLMSSSGIYNVPDLLQIVAQLYATGFLEHWQSLAKRV